ncbi:hypothetical protein GCM10010124_13890 [Pilimelia terevasa]|uniref:Uncharacterized protein n=1 Tax=Pilimelia terevasa TaxID=53372 RepID=A0A8J3FFW9_9ACTN|nr:DUF4760 domain-containing protein [Pilimelia terevasa]GGK22584.1 hypothetical protein GCM10010124_13890 [Pilimelia terevasa]
MKPDNLIALLSMMVSFLALVVSAVVALKQLRMLRHHNSLPIVVDMFQEFRSVEFRRHVHALDDLWTGEPPEATGTRDLPDEAWQHFTIVAGFLNNVGLMAHQGVIDSAVVRSFMSRTVTKSWYRLAPYVRHERALRGDPYYQVYFEHLAALCIARPPVDLRTQRVDPGWVWTESDRWRSAHLAEAGRLTRARTADRSPSPHAPPPGRPRR